MTAGLLALLLAAVLAVSGVAKLLDLRGSAATLRGFGMPERLVSALALCLPLAELAVAVTLVPVATGRAAAAAAALLFCCFSVVIAVTLLRGRRPDCGCFGRLHSAPIGWATFGRTAGLATVAGVLAATGTGDGVGVVGQPVAWLLAVTGGQSILLVSVLRRHGQTLARLDELDVAPDVVQLERGSQAPDFTLPDADGGRVSLADLRAQGRPTLLVFAQPGCGACTALLPEIGRWQREHRQRVTIALVTQGEPEVDGLDTVLRQQEREVADAYGVQWTPGALVVGADGLVDGPLQYGAEGVEAQLRRALELAPARRQRTSAAALVAVSAAVATPALAAPTDDEDIAIAELKRVLRSREQRIRRESTRLAAKTKRLFETPRSASVKFDLTSAIALAKKEIRWTIEELDAIPVPEYRAGEKGARLAKSDCISYLAQLELMLSRYAKVLQAKTGPAVERLEAEIIVFARESERRRRLAAKRLGCTKRLEEC
jgi:hypothetical protein